MSFRIRFLATAAMLVSTLPLVITAARAQDPPAAAPAVYNHGFVLASPDENFSLKANGLIQIRFTGFKPNANVVPLGESDAGAANFDLYLGRFAASGNAFSPNIKYFFQIQGSTVGNSNALSVLDWFMSDSPSKYLTFQLGRAWTPYSYEFYDGPTAMLFADLSAAEYAFVLPRAIGVQVSGQAGRLGYAAFVANSIPALDAGGQENFNTKLAYILHLEFNVLAPYGYQETDPSGPAATPELSLWASGAYNPVTAGSGLENLTAGDTTWNGTGNIGFRCGPVSLQGTGYGRDTRRLAAGSYDSWGWTGQAGVYVVPKRAELAARISGVTWGAADFGAGAPVASPPGVENAWFNGPGFSYHRVTEDSAGFNYYLHGHNAKVQVSYSYLHGATFAGAPLSASRVWIQTQLAF